MPLVEGLLIEAVKPLHAHPEIGAGCLKQKMHVVLHEAVRQAAPAVFPHDASEQREAEVDLSDGGERPHREQGGDRRQRNAELIREHVEEDEQLAVANDEIDEIRQRPVLIVDASVPPAGVDSPA